MEDSLSSLIQAPHWEPGIEFQCIQLIPGRIENPSECDCFRRAEALPYHSSKTGGTTADNTDPFKHLCGKPFPDTSSLHYSGHSNDKEVKDFFLDYDHPEKLFPYAGTLNLAKVEIPKPGRKRESPLCSENQAVSSPIILADGHIQKIQPIRCDSYASNHARLRYYGCNRLQRHDIYHSQMLSSSFYFKSPELEFSTEPICLLLILSLLSGAYYQAVFLSSYPQVVTIRPRKRTFCTFGTSTEQSSHKVLSNATIRSTATSARNSDTDHDQLGSRQTSLIFLSKKKSQTSSSELTRCTEIRKKLSMIAHDRLGLNRILALGQQSSSMFLDRSVLRDIPQNHSGNGCPHTLAHKPSRNHKYTPEREWSSSLHKSRVVSSVFSDPSVSSTFRVLSFKENQLAASTFNQRSLDPSKEVRIIYSNGSSKVIVSKGVLKTDNIPVYYKKTSVLETLRLVISDSEIGRKDFYNREGDLRLRKSFFPRSKLNTDTASEFESFEKLEIKKRRINRKSHETLGVTDISVHEKATSLDYLKSQKRVANAPCSQRTRIRNYENRLNSLGILRPNLPEKLRYPSFIPLQNSDINRTDFQNISGSPNLGRNHPEPYSPREHSRKSSNGDPSRECSHSSDKPLTGSSSGSFFESTLSDLDENGAPARRLSTLLLNFPLSSAELCSATTVFDTPVIEHIIPLNVHQLDDPVVALNLRDVQDSPNAVLENKTTEIVSFGKGKKARVESISLSESSESKVVTLETLYSKRCASTISVPKRQRKPQSVSDACSWEKPYFKHTQRLSAKTGDGINEVAVDDLAKEKAFSLKSRALHISGPLLNNHGGPTLREQNMTQKGESNTLKAKANRASMASPLPSALVETINTAGEFSFSSSDDETDNIMDLFPKSILLTSKTTTEDPRIQKKVRFSLTRPLLKKELSLTDGDLVTKRISTDSKLRQKMRMCVEAEWKRHEKVRERINQVLSDEARNWSSTRLNFEAVKLVPNPLKETATFEYPKEHSFSSRFFSTREELQDSAAGFSFSPSKVRIFTLSQSGLLRPNVFQYVNGAFRSFS